MPGVGATHRPVEARQLSHAGIRLTKALGHAMKQPNCSGGCRGQTGCEHFARDVVSSGGAERLCGSRSRPTVDSGEFAERISRPRGPKHDLPIAFANGQTHTPRSHEIQTPGRIAFLEDDFTVAEPGRLGPD